MNAGYLGSKPTSLAAAQSTTVSKDSRVSCRYFERNAIRSTAKMHNDPNMQALFMSRLRAGPEDPQDRVTSDVLERQIHLVILRIHRDGMGVGGDGKIP